MRAFVFLIGFMLATAAGATEVQIGGNTYHYDLATVKAVDTSPYELVETYTVTLLNADSLHVATIAERWRYALQDSTIDSLMVKPVNRGLYRVGQRVAVLGRGTFQGILAGGGHRGGRGQIPDIIESPPTKTLGAMWLRAKDAWENRLAVVPLEPTYYRGVSDIIDP